MVDIKPPETCGWCARPSNKPHRPNCPRPGEVFTATDLRNARAEARAAAEQRLRERIDALPRYARRGWQDGAGMALSPDGSWVDRADVLTALLPTQASDSKEKP